MSERHVRAAQVLQARVIQRLAAMDPSERLSPADMLRIWSESVRVERASRPSDLLASELGLETEPTDLADLDDEDLSALARRVADEGRRRRSSRRSTRPRFQLGS